VSWDGRSDFTRETDLICHMLQTRAGNRDPVRVTVLRDGREKELKLAVRP
jgi:hypothetical protein